MDARPLQALRGEIEERLSENRRTVRLRPLPSESGHEDLMGTGLAYASLFNELNCEKRQAFFNGELSPGKYYEIDSKHYYKLLQVNEVLGVNAQAAIQKNDEAWSTFFKQPDLKKQGRLMPHIRKVSPPGYWKDRLTGEKEIHIFVRSDRYYLEPKTRVEATLF
jgi:putative transposase